MSGRLLRRRGTAAEHATFTGSEGEFTYDKTNKRVVAHDGTTAGGWCANGMSPALLVEGRDGSNVKHGGNIQLGCLEELVTLSGATTDTTITFPNQCLIFGVSLRVVTLITGSGVTSFDIGRVGGAANEFGNDVGLTAGTTNQGLLGNPSGNYASTAVRITANGGTFSGGTVRVQINYLLCNPPTS
jgi:hypothetical protein